jgi:TetR/AcrR family transcriptional regulator
MELEPTRSSTIEGDRTRHAILKAAETLFVEQGFAATSMANIAKRAGITKSLIHHHFGSKRELWDAVKAIVMEEYGQQQQQLLSDREPGLALLRESIIVYFGFLRRNPNVVRLWTWMSVENDQHCADLSQDLTRAGVEILRKGQHAGAIRADVRAEFILAQFFSLVRGWFAERPILQSCILSEPDDVCDEEYLQSMLKVFLDGLTPRP